MPKIQQGRSRKTGHLNELGEKTRADTFFYFDFQNSIDNIISSQDYVNVALADFLQENINYSRKAHES